jgi:transcription elongation factor Elf1
MRNNEERFEQTLRQQDGNPPAQQSGGALNFVSPTEIVSLPSCGKYYAEGHPLHGKDSIEIRHMTAREEDILTSRSLLKKGTAIDKLLESIIVDKNIKLQDLLVGDKNALLIAARITGYGSDYETQITCPSCGEKSKQGFNLADHLERRTGNFEDVLPDDCERLNSGNILIKLPKSGWIVECRLLTGADEARMLKLAESRKRFADVDETKLSDQLENMIVAIQGVTDRVMLQKAIYAMPAMDSKHLRKRYQLCVPTVDLRTVFTCPTCNGEQEMEVPFTTDFFWPKQ